MFLRILKSLEVNTYIFLYTTVLETDWMLKGVIALGSGYIIAIYPNKFLKVSKIQV